MQFTYLVVYIIRNAIILFWIFDILDMPFMKIFDTTYPLNGWFWFLMFLFFGGGMSISKTNNDDEEE